MAKSGGRMLPDEVKKLAEQLIAKYAAPDFTYGGLLRSHTFHGLCNYKEKKLYLAYNSIRTASPEHTRWVIIHEITHTLVPEHGHDRVFVQTMNELVRRDLMEIRKYAGN